MTDYRGVGFSKGFPVICTTAMAQGYLLTWPTSKHQSTDFPRIMSLAMPYENYLMISRLDTI